MLNNVPKILSPELLKTLCEMGHSDVIVLGDGNFPGDRFAHEGNCKFLRCDGHGVPELLDAILTMIPFGCCMNNKSWFERSIFCYGYSTGVFAIGFVLLRIVDPENRSHTAEDVAMSPWLSLAEVFLWSAIPAALVSGNGWLVVVASLVVMAVSIAFCVVGKMWYTAPLNARGGYDKIQD